MERVFHKSYNYDEADAWDVRQQINMTPQERLRAAKQLKDRVYGQATTDVRESRAYNKRIVLFRGRSGPDSPTQ